MRSGGHEHDVYKSWSKQQPPNIAFVPRCFSRREALRKSFVLRCLVAFTRRYALPARRFTHAFRAGVTARSYLALKRDSSYFARIFILLVLFFSPK